MTKYLKNTKIHQTNFVFCFFFVTVHILYYIILYMYMYIIYVHINIYKGSKNQKEPIVQLSFVITQCFKG